MKGLAVWSSGRQGGGSSVAVEIGLGRAENGDVVLGWAVRYGLVTVAGICVAFVLNE